MIRTLSASFMLCGLLTLLGCSDGEKGPPKVKLSGKLSNKGAPLKLDAKGPPGSSKVELGFFPVGPDGKIPEVVDPRFGIISEDGSFTVDGGVVEGKYKVVIHQWNPFPDNDVLKKKFSRDNSSVYRDIKGDTTLELDISTLK